MVKIGVHYIYVSYLKITTVLSLLEHSVLVLDVRTDHFCHLAVLISFSVRPSLFDPHTQHRLVTLIDKYRNSTAVFYNILATAVKERSQVKENMQ